MTKLPGEPSVDGVLIVDKPQDWTSHDVCAFVRKRFQIKKVGHAGTLDPLATGVLVMLLGRATKSSAELSSCDKEYLGVMELGVATDSHDRTGQVIGEKSWEGVTLERVREKARAFTGNIIQVPPMISALKHKGVRLYKLARQGQTVPREGRPVTIHTFDIQSQEGPFVKFSARVSKGTYLRTLIHDLGESLDCFAALAQLRRVRSGEFSLRNCVTVEGMRQMTLQDLRRHVYPLYSALFHANSNRS